MPEEESKVYSRKYYAENRAAIAERKRLRYLNDSEYRARIKESARVRKNRLLEERREERAKNGIKEKPIWFKIDVNGLEVPVRMYTTGQLAKRLGRKTQTMRVWERKGILPEALYRSATRDRLYTAFQVAGILVAYDEAEQSHGTSLVSFRIASTSFVAAVKRLWDDFPLGLDERKL